MPLDGLTLSLLTKEIAAEITESRIEKIHQPAKDELVLYLRSRKGAKKLLVSLSSSIPHICLTENTPENPPVPPMFCMFLRKHLTGCIIRNVQQLSLDRTMFMDISGTNEIGDAVKMKLVVELMPKHANFIVVNEDNVILEAIRHTESTITVDRRIQPGFKYTLPPLQNKLNILEVSTDQILDRITENRNAYLSNAILQAMEGVSPLVSREMACEVCGNDIGVSEMTQALITRLKEVIDNLRNLLISGGTPTMLIKEDSKPFDFSFSDIKQFGFSVSAKSYETYSELIDSFYSEKTRTERTSQQGRELQKYLSNLLSRSLRKLETRKKELSECSGKDEFRINAELILANQYVLEKGSLYYDLQNFYDDYNPIRIKADPALSPAANAQKYFKEYNKLKNAEKLLDTLIEESETEVTYLESVIDAVKRADGFTEIGEIRSELSEQGYLKKNKNQKNQKQKKLAPIEYVSDDGYLILVGRNNIQNERLSLKESRKDDSWFHTQSFPGSHVVVVGNGDILPERTCRQAAAIAAYNSSARDSSQVAVDYTEIRELKKPKGGKPGMVIYHTYNTMWVTPDRELCERLKKQKAGQNQ